MNLPPELFLIAMFVLMYFLLIRPQQKRAKDHKNLLKALKNLHAKKDINFLKLYAIYIKQIKYLQHTILMIELKR